MVTVLKLELKKRHTAGGQLARGHSCWVMKPDLDEAVCPQSTVAQVHSWLQTDLEIAD